MISNRFALARVWQMAACSWKTRRSRIMPSYMRIHAYYSSDTLGRQAAWRSLPPPGEASGSPDASPLPKWHASRVHAQTSSNAFVWLFARGTQTSGRALGGFGARDEETNQGCAAGAVRPAFTRPHSGARGGVSQE